MRKLIYLYAVLLLFGGIGNSAIIEVPEAVGGMIIQSVASGACSTPTTGDELNEGFLDTGYENTWNETLDGETINEDHTLQGSPPTGSCTEGIRIYTTGGQPNTHWTHGTSIPEATDVDVYFSLFIDSNTSLANYGQRTIIDYSYSITWNVGRIAFVELKNDNETYYLRGYGTATSSNIPSGGLSFDTWYECILHIDATSTTSCGANCTGSDSSGCSYLEIVGGDRACFSRNTGNDFDNLHIGAENNGSETLDFEIGYIYIDTP